MQPACRLVAFRLKALFYAQYCLFLCFYEPWIENGLRLI